MQTLQTSPKASAWRIFWIFTSIGLQSFGGGASTTLLMQRYFIDKYRWITIDDFAYLWSLCQLAPGVNLVGFTILVGKRVGGIAGMFSALIGLMVPSSIITFLLAAGFKEVQHLPVTQAVEKGVIPATAGIMLLVGLNFAFPQVKKAHTEGLLPLAITVVIILLGTVAILAGVPVIVVLPAGGILGIVCFTRPLFLSRKDRAQ